eukprot:gene14138-30103_t
MEDIGFMFGTQTSKVVNNFQFPLFSIQIRMIDSEPGHIQSGQYLWPAAQSLSQYLIDNWLALESDVIIELGAGCGLTGLVASKLSNNAHIILTDYDYGALTLLQENIELNNNNFLHTSVLPSSEPSMPKSTTSTSTSNNSSPITGETTVTNIRCQLLEWGAAIPPDMEYTIKQTLITKTLTQSSSQGVLIIGSDLLYCKSIVRPLLVTVRNILTMRRDGDVDGGMFLLMSSFDFGE